MSRSGARLRASRASLIVGLAAALSALNGVDARAQAAPAAEPTAVERDPQVEASCDGPAEVGALAFEGCTTERCGRPDVQARLRLLTDLTNGSVVDRARVERARRRLLATRLVADVLARCRPLRDGRLRIRFDVIPQRYVSKVRISGHEAFFRSEIAKRLLVERGVPLTPGTPEADDLVQRQRSTLERLYHEAGFDEPKIGIELEATGDEGVDVTLTIEEGRRKKVGSVEVEMHLVERSTSMDGAPDASDSPAPPRAPAPDEADDGEGEGPLHCVHPSDVELARQSGLSVGSAFTERHARDARRDIRRYLQARGFVRPAVMVSLASESRDGRLDLFGRGVLRIDVTYQGCYVVDVVTRESGGDPFHRPTDDLLLESLSFAESGNFDWEEALYGRELLVQALQAQGFLFAHVEVDYRLVRWARNDLASSPVKGRIRFQITTGALTEIRDVTVDGLPEEGREEAVELIETRPYDFFSPGGYLQLPRLIADLERVARHYRDRGYLQFTFEGAAEVEELVIIRMPTTADEIFVVSFGEIAFRILRPRAESYIYVRAGADAGPRTNVGPVRVSGTRALDEVEVVESFGMRRGQPFVRNDIVRGLRIARARYRALGHDRAQLSAECSSPQRPAMGRISCVLWSEPVEEVSIHLRVDEGPRLVVGELLWSGNFRTRDEIIRRDLPDPGTPFDGEAIRQGLRRLRRLGVFNAVRPIFIGLDEAPPRDRVGIVVQLHEGPAKLVEVAVGLETISRRKKEDVPENISKALQNLVVVSDDTNYGQAAGHTLRLPDVLIVGELAYVDRNFGGRAQEIILPVRYGLSTTELNKIISVTPTWIHRRLLGSEVVLRVTPFVDFDRTTLDVLDTFEHGIETEISQRFFERITLSLQYEISRIRTRRVDVDDASFGPYSLQNKVRPQVIFDFLDSPIHPTRGQYLATSVAYINALEKGEPRNFLKFDVRLKLFANIARTLIGGIFLRYGQARSFQGGRLPDTERFVLGGNRGVRGFDNDGILQYADDRTIITERAWSEDATLDPPWRSPLPGLDGRVVPILGGDLLLHASFELRVPILRASGLWGATFYDVGSLSESFEDLGPSSVRQSVGAGLRFLIGESIPVRLDYGVKLNRRCADLDREGACIRRESVGNLHFGILYTF